VNNFNKFSVLLPVYSGENPTFFDLCLDSISHQTLEPTEVIIVKDGEIGTELEKVITKYAKKLNIICTLYEGNLKLTGALLHGLKHCSYELIARVDSDDIYHKDRFLEQVKYMSKENISVLGTHVMEFNNKINDLKIIRKGSKGTGNILRSNPVHHASVIFRKSDIISSGNYKPLEGFEDWYLWLRVNKNGYRIENIPKVLTYARVGSNFFKRRSGIKYVKQEINAHILFYKDNLLPLLNILINLLIRLPVRMAPEKLIKLIYVISRKI